MKLLKKDLKNILPGAIAAVTVCTIFTLIFGTCCPLRIFIGLPCPACGTIRSLLALLRFDFRNMIWYQPVMPLLLLFFVFFCYMRYYRNKTDKKLFLRLLGIILIIGISAYVYRMQKYYPDHPPLEYTQNNIYTNLRRFLNEH